MITDMINYRVTSKEIASQKEFLKNLEKEGKLEEYLRDEPNFMYSLLADPRVTDEEANSIIGSLFGAGIETVGILSAGFTFICSRLKPRASRSMCINRIANIS